MPVADRHAVLGTPLKPPFPEGFEQRVVGMGCFWGAERVFWQAPGVYTTAVGYAGGFTPNPTYEEVCSGTHRPHRGRAGRVRSRQDLATRRSCGCSGRTTTRPRACARATTSAPSTARRSTGSTTRSAQAAEASRDAYAERCGPPATARSRPRSPTAGPFYYAEDYHQQYLAQEPVGLLRARRDRASAARSGVGAPAAGATAIVAAHRRAAPAAAEAQPPATAGRIVTSSPSVTGGVEPVEEADVLAADVDVDEPPQAAVLGDPAAQLAVALVQRVEHLADGRAVDRRRSPRRRSRRAAGWGS